MTAAPWIVEFEFDQSADRPVARLRIARGGSADKEARDCMAGEASRRVNGLGTGARYDLQTFGLLLRLAAERAEPARDGWLLGPELYGIRGWESVNRGTLSKNLRKFVRGAPADGLVEFSPGDRRRPAQIRLRDAVQIVAFDIAAARAWLRSAGAAFGLRTRSTAPTTGPDLRGTRWVGYSDNLIVRLPEVAGGPPPYPPSRVREDPLPGVPARESWFINEITLRFSHGSKRERGTGAADVQVWQPLDRQGLKLPSTFEWWKDGSHVVSCHFVGPARDGHIADHGVVMLTIDPLGLQMDGFVITSGIIGLPDPLLLRIHVDRDSQAG